MRGGAAGFDALCREIRSACGVTLEAGLQPVSGGDINGAWAVRSGTGRYFLKTNTAANADLLESECDGLSALAATGCVRVPTVLGHGVAGDLAWLLMEWIDAARPDAAAEARLGRALAAMHMQLGAAHGWPRDNHIGRSRQHNTPHEDWLRFFLDCRLRPQLAMSGVAGTPLARSGEHLVEQLPLLLAGYAPSPSLLHGDLWGGNWLCATDGQPVLIDPAVHYGDRECDLAMMTLFGGFGSAVFEAYEAVLPPRPGDAMRRDLYQLYHVLNHVNLFGGGFAAQAEALMQRLFMLA